MQRPSHSDTAAAAAAAPLPAAASPNSVTRLADKLAQLVVADGGGAEKTHVSWSVALKPPSSSQAVVVDGGDAKREWQERAADEWLARCILSEAWTGWVAYNDEPAEGSGVQASVSFGHCKGLLCWSADRVGWLVHSVPGWPSQLGERELTTLAGTKGAKKGQSFVWLCMARTPERLRAICGQIQLCDACVYAGRITPDEEPHVPFREDTFGQHLKNPPPGPDPSLVPLGPGVWHLAKHALWGRVRRDGRPVALDFYEDSLARTPPFEGRWHVQSWLNGVKDEETFGTTERADNIVQIRLPDGAPYDTTKDHSKWAVHSKNPFTLVGDINRMQSQSRRGGGGVIIQDAGLNRALRGIIYRLEGELALPPAPPLRSVDEFHASPSDETAYAAGAEPLDVLSMPPLGSGPGFGGGGGGGGGGAQRRGGGGGGLLGGLFGAGLALLGNAGFGGGPRSSATQPRGMSTVAAALPERGADAAPAVGGSSGAQGGAGGAAAPAVSGVSDAQASSSGMLREGSTSSLGGGSDADSKGPPRCNCKPSNCGRFKCGCKGHLCTELCACKGQCDFTLQALAAAAGGQGSGGAAAAQPPAAAAEAAGPRPAAPGVADEAPALAPPVAAVGAAFQAMMKNMAAAAAAAKTMQDQQQQQQQHVAAGSPAGAAEAGADCSASPPSSSVAPDGRRAGAAAGDAPGCRCKKGCQDKRCPCKHAGQACGPHCTCTGCSNCV